MSISSEVRRAGPYSGNGSTTAFAFAFKVFNTSQVQVTRTVSGVETVLTLTTHYTVSLNANQNTNPGGTVTMLTAPAVGQSITITSNVANLQPTAIANLGGFYPEVINDSLDRATIQIQQLDERLDRALVIPVSSSGVSTQLPVPASSKLIGWDSAGTALQNYNNIPVGSTVYQYVHRTIATAGQTAVALPITYTVGAMALSVFVNGLRVEQGSGLDYVETNSSTITFTSGLSAGDLVVVAIHGDIDAAATPPNYTIESIAALRLLTGTTSATQLILLWNHVAGDGGGVFRYDSTDTTTADNGGTVIVDAAGKRWKRQYADGYIQADWFGILDNNADRTSALNAAISASASATLILPAGTIRLDGQIVINVSNITIQGAGRLTTTLDLNYTSGPAIEVGDQTSQKREIIFRDLYLQGMAGQDLIRTRWVRGIRFWGCNYVADCFLRLGETTDDTAKATYICELHDIEGAHIASPTKHHVIAANFQGQWVAESAFVEGTYNANYDGFHASPNIQQRIDHFIVQGGYWSRFRDNYSFVDARVVNLQIDDSHHSEGAVRNAVRLYTTTSTAKAVGNVGWENVSLSGKYNSLNDSAIYIRGERTGVSCNELSIIDAQFIGEVVTPVYIISDDGVIDTVMIDNLTVAIAPTNANQDVVLVTGGNVSSVTITNVSIGQIAGVAIGTALRSVVRIDGRVARITPPTSLAVTNVTTPYDDSSNAATRMSMVAADVETTDYVTVLDQSADFHRPIYVRDFADALPRVMTRQATRFRLWLRNNAGTLEHRITAPDGSSAAAAEFVAKINAASSTYAASPTGADASTAMASGAKISTADPNYLIFDTPDQATVTLSSAIATLNYNTNGTVMTVYPLMKSGNVNGVTRTRLTLGFLNASSGAAVNINTTNWASGAISIVDIWAHLA